MTAGADAAAQLRRSAAHALVVDLDHPELRPDQQHHLVRVRRLRDGDPVTVTDGQGRWRATRLRLAAAAGRRGADATLEPDGPVLAAALPPPVGIAVALTKGDRPEQVVAQLTELGVARITLVAADRSVVVWDAATGDRHRQRLRVAMAEALEQSRGVRLPHLDGPMPLAELAAHAPATVALAEPGGEPWPAGDAVTTIAIGPEGGWSPRELALGRRLVALPGSVLRAPTAAVVAATLLLSAVRTTEHTTARGAND
jgi:16S rRNA (uracil1498-N3)-methyltransferase